VRIVPLLASDRVAVPWKNKGGVTREVAVFPPGAGMADFLWRVSIAEVAEAGPFSIFPGVDRILTVLDGTLDLGGIALSPGEPFAFPGDVPIEGRPIDGPVADLNLMMRRDRVRGSVRRVASGVTLACDTALLVSLGSLDALLIEDANGPIAIEGEALLIEMTRL
jgi:environmental stress-induced protein Ves